MTNYALRIESFPMNPPKPTGVGAFADGKMVAYFSIDEMRDAVRRYDEMEAQRNPPRTIDNVTEVYIFASNGFVNTAKRGEANTSTSRMTGEVTLGIGQRMVIERGDGVMKLEVLP